MLKRWQTPIALLLVFVLTNVVYTRMKHATATISEQRDEQGNVLSASEFVKGRVLSVVRVYKDPSSGNEARILEFEILGGKFKGKRALFRNYIHPNGFPLLNIDVPVGGIALLRIGHAGEILNARNLVQNYNRDGFFILLLGVLFSVIIIVGRATGIRASITMVLNGVIMYYVMLPMLYKGYDPVWTIVLTSTLVSIQARLIVAGFGRKTYAAILGSMGGIILVGFVLMNAQANLHFTGVEKSDAGDLVEAQAADFLDFAGLMMAGMLLGLLGIAHDAAIEVASAMEEVNEANPRLTIPQLIQSGMNVGTDILGTMTNTVLFLYIGMRLIVIVTLMGTDIVPVTAGQFFSLGVIASEVVRIVAGTFGLVLTVPLTAVISGLFHLYARKRKAYAA